MHDNPLQLQANSRLEAAICDDPEEQTIDLTIEALTGTIYDLCASPFIGIKQFERRCSYVPYSYVNYKSTRLRHVMPWCAVCTSKELRQM